jgi:hypothetical protein
MRSAHLKVSKRVAHAEQLVKEVVAAKKADRASERHLRDTKGRLKLFAEAFKGRKILPNL